VPAEIVAADRDVMGFGEVHEEIGLGEIEAVLLRMGGAPLHGVFGDEDGALVEEQRSEVGALELRVGDGGAEEEAFGKGNFAELGEFGGGRRERKSGYGQRTERKFKKIAASHGQVGLRKRKEEDKHFLLICHRETEHWP
jgi:hypothetical protein